MPEYSRKKKDQAVNLETLMGNKPPQALDVEAAVLGAMLVEPSTIDESMEELTASCFYDPKHRMIFEAMSSLVNEHVAIDLISVSEKLRSQGNLESVGGPVVLADLSQNIGAAAHIEYYLKILKQKTIQRDLITASYAISTVDWDPREFEDLPWISGWLTYKGNPILSKTFMTNTAPNKIQSVRRFCLNSQRLNHGVMA